MLPLQRSLLRRPPRVKVKRSHPLLPLRLQHDQHGPHKEYFQHPSQFPSHAYQLRVPPPNLRARSAQQQPFLEPSTSALPPVPKRRSLLRRLLRSVLIVSVCLTLGWASGTAVVTWDYLQPPFEPGSEEAEELIEEIDEMLEGCTLVQDLREAGFQEEQIQRPLNSSHHLVTGTLNDVQGFKTKFFRHPQNTGLSVMVFFAGFGVEGWPDYVHGGAITTMMTEAAQQHCAPIFELGDLEALPSGQLLTIQFVAPVRPAEIYAVLVHEQTASVRPRELSVHTGPIDLATAEAAIAHGMNAYLVSSDSFPPELVGGFGIQPAPQAETEEVHTAQPQTSPGTDGEEGHVSVLTLPDSAFLHAAASIDVMSKSKHIVREDDEDPQSYGKRLAIETQRVMQKIHSNVVLGN